MSNELSKTDIAGDAFAAFVGEAKSRVNARLAELARIEQRHQEAVEAAQRELAEVVSQRDTAAADLASHEAAVEAMKEGGGSALGRAAETLAYVTSALIPSAPIPDGNVQNLTDVFLASRGWRRVGSSQWERGGQKSPPAAAVQAEIREAFSAGLPLLTSSCDRQQPDSPPGALASRLIKVARWISPPPTAALR